MSLKTLVAVFAGAIAAFSLRAEGLVVAEGEEKTLSASATYETIVVNGTLNIDSGADIQVSTTVVVGSATGKTGRLNISEGATLRADSTKNTSLFYFGKDGGSAVVTVNGATVQAYDVYLGHNPQDSTTSSLVLTGESLVRAQNSFSIEGGTSATTASDAFSATVRLGEGARIYCWSVAAFNNRKAKMEFAGGTLQLALVQRKGTGDLVFESIDGCPIDFNVDPSQYATYLFLFDTTPEGSIHLKGDGEFRKRGSANIKMCRAGSASHILFEYAGGTQILGGGLSLQGAYQFPRGGALTVARGAVLNLSGYALEVSELSGFGTVTNDSSTAGSLQFDVGQGKETASYCALKGGVGVVKKGSGTLSLMTDGLGALSVEAGKVKFLSPSLRGFPEYRFKVDLPYGNIYDGLHFSELTFYNGETVVTTPYAGIGPSEEGRRNLFDGDRSTKWWFSCNYQTQTDFSDAYVDVRYDSPRALTDYTWSTAADTPPSNANCRDPGAWRLLGRVAGGDWRELSRVNRGDYSLEMRKAETDRFPVGYGTLDIALASLSVANIASVEMEKGVRLVLPNTGTQTIYGTITGDAVGIVGGTLKPVTGTDSPWRYYRVVIDKTKAGTLDKIQFSEFALYDEAGSRINLTANIESATIKNPPVSDTNLRLYDGVLTSVYYQDDKNKGEFSFVLKEGAARKIVGYLFAIDTSNNIRAPYAPSSWTIYAKERESDEWTLVESVQNYQCVQVQNWTAFNGGVPFPFTGRKAKDVPAFASPTEVTVGGGGVLDLSASDTTISKIRLDAALAAGTIRGATFAETGTLYLDGFDGGKVPSGYELPISFDGASELANVANWEFVVNGKKSSRTLMVSGGRVFAVAKGLILVVE